MAKTMNTTQKPKKPAAPKLFPDELIDQLLAQVQNKDAETVLGKSGRPAKSRSNWPNACWRRADAQSGDRSHAGPSRQSSQRQQSQDGHFIRRRTGAFHPARPAGTFEPKLVAKHQRQLPGFDDRIICLYARGMAVREIQGQLLELYGQDVSPDLISTITDEVLADVGHWQQRPFEATYPIVC